MRYVLTLLALLWTAQLSGQTITPWTPGEHPINPLPSSTSIIGNVPDT